jgi:carbon storage regulator
MLVLGRRRGQRIMVGDDIVLTVVAINGPNVRIGIEAPDDVDVYREEVYEQLQEE